MANDVEKEKLRVYEALLCSPGMNDLVKVNFQMSRKDILLLSKVVEKGLNENDESGDILVGLIPKGSRENCQAVMNEVLSKAGLVDFVEKLKGL